MWQLLLLWWSWSPLCLPSSVSFIGTPQQCQEAQFVPGYNLGGEGFDIVTMKRKGAYVIDTETWKLGNGTCRLFINSYMEGKKQKVPAAVVDWRTLPKCNSMVSSVVYGSVETLVNDSTSSVSNDWKIGLNVPVNPTTTVNVGLGGSHSRESAFGMKKSKEDHYTFLKHSVHCDFYRYRMATKSPLSHDFQSAVNSLPSYSCKTAPSYRNLIDTYGTHYITQVFLGGGMKAVTAVRTCQATMNGLSTTEVNDCLTVEASVGFAKTASIDSMVKHCQEKKKKLNHDQSFSSTFNERITECQEAHFVPGYNLGGEGFNIVTMEQKGAYVIDIETWKLGNGTCRLYINSYMERKIQKVQVAVVDWRILPKCILKVSSIVYDSVETLVSDSTASVSNDWKIGLNLTIKPTIIFGPIYGGSHSKESTFAMQKSEEDRYTFFHHSVHSNFY
eukprot:superscaffoldBa00000601_g5976